MKDNAIFRTSALLYADNNYDVKTEKIILKIIESVFVIQNNIEYNYDDLLRLLSEYYSLEFEIDELSEVIIKFSDNFIIKHNKNEVFKLRLTNSRYALLKKKLSDNDIELYINLFLEQCNYEKNIKTLIYRFLHYILNTNLHNFKQMLDSDINTSKLLANFDGFSAEK